MRISGARMRCEIKLQTDGYEDTAMRILIAGLLDTISDTTSQYERKPPLKWSRIFKCSSHK